MKRSLQPYPLALALLSAFSIFIVELFAFRIGTAKLKKLGVYHGMSRRFPIGISTHIVLIYFFHPDAHGHHTGGVVAHGPEGSPVPGPASPRIPDVESMHLEKPDKSSEAGHSVTRVDDATHITTMTDESAMAQLIGVGILEFGVILHRFVKPFPLYGQNINDPYATAS
jgi:zinc transporter 1/2/3